MPYLSREIIQCHTDPLCAMVKTFAREADYTVALTLQVEQTLDQLCGSGWRRRGVEAIFAEMQAAEAEAAAYQDQIAGYHPGFVYEVNGVTFDGYDERRGVFVDAKSSYAQFIKDGEFAAWFTGDEALITQARNQIKAAKGIPIEWHIGDEGSAQVIRAHFIKNGITGITVIYTPKKK